MLYTYKATLHPFVNEFREVNGIIDVSRSHWMPEQRIREYLLQAENVEEISLENFECKPVPQI